jgi:hypothetical protein
MLPASFHTLDVYGEVNNLCLYLAIDSLALTSVRSTGKGSDPTRPRSTATGSEQQTQILTKTSDYMEKCLKYETQLTNL